MAGKRLALIIGNSSYRDVTLSRLKVAEVDVGALAEVLEDPEIGAFDEAKVVINASSAVVRRAITDFFSKKSRDDLLLMYFSGHGVLDERGRLHLAVKDTEPALLRGTAIPASYIADEMDNSYSQRQVLILDCCHSGAFSRGTKRALGSTVGTAAIFEGTGFGRVVLTATDATQYAWEGERIIGEVDNSLFTHYLVEGLQTGQADINCDGKVTVDELYDYVYERVLKSTPKQTPGKWSFKEQGEIIIAHSVSSEISVPVRDEVESKSIKLDIDEELLQKENKLYTKGLSAYWLEDWDKAIGYLSELLNIDPNFQDAREKFDEASRKQMLERLYKKGQDALKAGDYKSALPAFEEIIKEAPDYKDAALMLKNASKEQTLTDLYAEARQLSQANEWQAVVNVFERIHHLQPNSSDPDQLLNKANQEIEANKRMADAGEKYSNALKAMQAGEWADASRLFREVLNIVPGFEEAPRLLIRAEDEFARHEEEKRIQAHAIALYEQARGCANNRKWREALAKIEEIQKLKGDFPDPNNIVEQARFELTREEQIIWRKNEIDRQYADAARSLQEKDYQAALEKWKKIHSLDPAYPDKQRVESTAQKKLAAPSSTPVTFHLSKRNLIIGGLILACCILLTRSLSVFGPGSSLPPTQATLKPTSLSTDNPQSGIQTPVQSILGTESASPASPLINTITPPSAPTPSLSPTRTITPLLSATIDADPDVYDNFNNPYFDGSYNLGRWSLNPNYYGSIIQQNNELALVIKEKNTISISANAFPLISNHFYVEAQLKLENQTGIGGIYLLLTVGRTEIFCQVIQKQPDSPYVFCHVNQDGLPYLDYGTTKAVLGQWNTVRIEMNSLSGIVDFYINQKKLGQYSLTQKEKASSDYGVEIWIYSASAVSTKGFCDNVRIHDFNKTQK